MPTTNTVAEKWSIYRSCFPDLQRHYGVIVAYVRGGATDNLLVKSFAFETGESGWKVEQSGQVSASIGRLFYNNDEFEYGFDVVSEKAQNEWEAKTCAADERFFSQQIVQSAGVFRASQDSDKLRTLYSHLRNSSDGVRADFERWIRKLPAGEVNKIFQVVLSGACAPHSL